MLQRILVVGATGLLGEPVANSLREARFTVRVMSRDARRARAKFAEPLDDDEMNNLLTEQGELQEKIDAADGWDLERTVGIAMDALRCPPSDADVTKISGSATAADNLQVRRNVSGVAFA